MSLTNAVILYLCLLLPILIGWKEDNLILCPDCLYESAPGLPAESFPIVLQVPLTEDSGSDPASELVTVESLSGQIH